MIRLTVVHLNHTQTSNPIPKVEMKRVWLVYFGDNGSYTISIVCYQLRLYLLEHTGSRSISKVKLARAPTSTLVGDVLSRQRHSWWRVSKLLFCFLYLRWPVGAVVFWLFFGHFPPLFSAFPLFEQVLDLFSPFLGFALLLRLETMLLKLSDGEF